MQVILKQNQIAALVNHLAEQIVADLPDPASLALIGIRSRGETLAQRLQTKLQAQYGAPVDCGTLDITLYRDDLYKMGYQQPTVRATEIDFNIDDRYIVLVDDVLSTGRSVRAALNALADLGRGRAIKLAVLIDRGHRELPISADYIGQVIDAPEDQRVQVWLREVDDREEVTLE